MLPDHTLRLACSAILFGILCPVSATAASDHPRTKIEKKQPRGFSPLGTKKKKKKQARKQKKMSKEARAIHQILTSTQIPFINMENAPFEQVLSITRAELQRKGSPVNIIPLFGSCDSNQYKQKMSQCITLYIQDVSVADMLTLACIQAGLEYTIIDQGVAISIPKDGSAGCAIPVDEAQAKEDDARIQAIRQTLVNTRIPSLDVENVTIMDLIDYLRGILRRNGKKANFFFLPGNANEEKYSKLMSQRITLKLNDVSVDDILTLAGMQLGIKHTIMPQGVAIGSAGDTP